MVCLDEKRFTLHDDVRPFSPAKPGREARPDNEYERCGTWLEYPEAKTIHLVMDNLNSHRKKSLTDLYGDEIGSEIRERFTVHYTPTHEVGSIRRKSKSASSHGRVWKQKNPT